jgi:hypothetical protein
LTCGIDSESSGYGVVVNGTDLIGVVPGVSGVTGVGTYSWSSVLCIGIYRVPSGTIPGLSPARGSRVTRGVGFDRSITGRSSLSISNTGVTSIPGIVGITSESTDSRVRGIGPVLVDGLGGSREHMSIGGDGSSTDICGTLVVSGVYKVGVTGDSYGFYSSSGVE